MTAPIDDFDSDEFRSAKPGYQFRLGGREWHCRAEVSWFLLQRQAENLALAKTAVERVDELKAAEPDLSAAEIEARIIEEHPDLAINVRVGDFMAMVLVPEEVDDFMAMISGPKSPLHTGNMLPMMDRITAALSGRDPIAPASSGRGPKRTAAKSAAKRSSPATPSKPSTRSRGGRPST